MSEVQTNARLTVGWETKVNRELRGGEKYENEVASIYLPVDVPVGTDREELSVLIKEAYFEARAHIYEQLNVPTTVDQELGVIRMLEEQLGAKVVETKTKTYVKSAPAAAGADKEELWATLQTEYEQGDGSFAGNTKSFYDNRVGKRNPKAPDFKHKDSGDGLWLNRAPEWYGPTS